MAAVILGALAVFLAGAGIATTLGAWGLAGGELLEAVGSGSRDAWALGNLLLAMGVAGGAAGMAALAGQLRSPIAWAGAALWLVAAGVGSVDFLAQGYLTLAAVDAWSPSGDVPETFALVEVWRADGLRVFYGGVAMLGTAAVGIAMARASWLPVGVGVLSAVVGGAGAALIFLGVDLIPAVVQWATAIAGVGVLFGSPASERG